MLHLPRRQNCRYEFMCQVLSNKKKVFYEKEIHLHKVPLWPELSVERIWDSAMMVPGFRDYIPDYWKKDGKVDRNFFWSIFTKLSPELVDEIVKNVREKRQNRHFEAIDVSKININEQWADKLIAKIGNKPGKFLSLPTRACSVQSCSRSKTGSLVLFLRF